MKKLFFLPLFAAVVFSGCSSEDLPNGDEGSNDTNTNYLSISIVPTAATASKATAGDGKPDADAEYEDGTTAENAVSKVRFYFFDAAGEAANVKANSTANYWDWTSPSGTGTDATGPVERQLDAVVIISTKAGDKLPAQLVAVLNPGAELGDGALSLAQLRTKYADYASLANADNASFVMCNSVYADATSNEISATTIGMEKYATTADGAKNNPVYVYVERNVAKVQVALGNGVSLDDNGLMKVTKYDSKTQTTSDYTIGGTQVYVKFQGWDVTGDLNQAWLSKSIDASWTNESLFGSANISWNYAPYFRSFWAKECTAEGTANQYKSYSAAYSKTFDGSTYCNENAARATGADAKKPTQVIIPALLCDESGNALSIYEYAGVQGISTDDYAALKKAYLGNLQTTYYKKTDSGRMQIEESDITFITATAAGIITAGASGAYYVYPCLTTAAEGETWYNSADESVTETLTADDINAALKGLQHAKIWETGYTYYYFDIEHLGSAIGVVRNHLYKATIDNVYGLGTPVYDPNEVIYPEKPEGDDAYIAAKINILSWRLVPSNITLTW